MIDFDKEKKKKRGKEKGVEGEGENGEAHSAAFKHEDRSEGGNDIRHVKCMGCRLEMEDRHRSCL